MAQTVTWYLTDVSRATSSGPWTVQGPSTEVLVWFGEQTEWNALSAAEKAQYDIYIIDEAGGPELVDADELRAAMVRYDSSYSFPNNSGYLGTQDIDDDGDPSTPLVPSVGLAVDGTSIESSKLGVLITLDPVTATAISDGYKSGKGNFDPFRPGKLTPPCFTRGTMIRTPQGDRPVELLRRGDLVLTADHGAQPIMMIASAALNERQLTAEPHLRPIRIRAGALGAGQPAQDLLVSPQHRMLVRSRIARRMFGADEVLIAAKQLIGIDGIDVAEDSGEVEYFHMLFADHEIVIANGAETESLYVGAEALGGLGDAALAEVYAIFPELRHGIMPFAPARQLVHGPRARRMSARHSENLQALVS